MIVWQVARHRGSARGSYGSFQGVARGVETPTGDLPRWRLRIIEPPISGCRCLLLDPAELALLPALSPFSDRRSITSLRPSVDLAHRR